MRIRGIKYICDRCGKTKFFELDSEGSFKEPCKFHLLDIGRDQHLCEECENKRKNLMDWFLRGNIECEESADDV